MDQRRARTQLLISPDELAADPSCLIFDCRYSLFDKQAGRRSYEAAHIPGARYADLEHDLSAPAGHGGRHPLPDQSDLVERLRSWGANDDSRLVCYDQNSGALAGRFWWLLRWLGHREVYLLDGGMDAWLGAGLATSAEMASPASGNFSLRPPLTRTCTAADLPDAEVNLLDAREAVRFHGESEPIDAVAGHIPGAISAPFTENMADGRFLTPTALAARFSELGVDPARDTVCYCGSGVTANHNIIALMLAGFDEPILYPGSWSEWIEDPERPVATD